MFRHPEYGDISYDQLRDEDCSKYKPISWEIEDSSQLKAFLKFPAEHLTELTTLIIGDLDDDSWLEEDAEFEKFPKTLLQCNALQTVNLNRMNCRTNPKRFIALGDTLAKLKNVQIDLSFSAFSLVQDRQDQKELAKTLSFWPIKRLDLSFSKGGLSEHVVIHPVFFKYLAKCPIQFIDLSNCTLDPIFFKSLEKFLAQSKTVRSINLGHFFRRDPYYNAVLQTYEYATDNEMDQNFQAFCNALAQGKQLEALNLEHNLLDSFFSRNDNNFKIFCSALAQLKNLRFINLADNGFMRSNHFEILCRDYLTQCPDLQSMVLDSILDSTYPSSVTFQNIFNGLRYLSVLSDVDIDDLVEEPTDDLVKPGKSQPGDKKINFKRIELVLQACGLIGDARREHPLFLVRDRILSTAYGRSYAEYYREGFFSHIKEQNRRRYLEPFITVSLALHYGKLDKKIRLNILTNIFPRPHDTKLAESVDNSVTKVLSARTSIKLAGPYCLEDFLALSLEHRATLKEIHLCPAHFHNTDNERFNYSPSHQLLSLSAQKRQQFRDSVLQCTALQSFFLADYLQGSKIDGLIALGMMCVELGLLNTFEVEFQKSFAKLDVAQAKELTSSFKRLQGEFDKIAFKTKGILFSKDGEALTFTFARQSKKLLASEETTGNTLRIANG